MDSEDYKMLCAERCKKTRTGGFEGCSRCDYAGFYLCTYSRESYCDKCELECFPERFYPCPYCRKPWSMQMTCIGCSAQNIIGFSSYELQGTDFELWCSIHNWESEICKLTVPGQFIVNPNETYFSSEKTNQGFYMGNNTWKQLNYIPKMTSNAVALEEPDPRFAGLTEFLQNKIEYAKKVKELSEKEISYKNLEKRLNAYVHEMNYVEQIHNLELEVLLAMITEFDLFGPKSGYIAFLVWHCTDKLAELMNNKRWKIDINRLCRSLLKENPDVEITGFHGFNPLGGFSGSSNISVDHYNILKFVAQFTNDIEIFNKVKNCFEFMPPKIKGPIRDPGELLYLMSYNPFLGKTMVPKPPNPDRINILYDFYYSVYCPDPSFEREYDEFKSHRQKILVAMLGEDELPYLLMIKFMLGSHYHPPKEANDLFHHVFCKVELNEETKKIIKNIGDKLIHFVITNNRISVRKNTRVDLLGMLTEENYMEIRDILSTTCIYVSDEDFNDPKNRDRTEKFNFLFEKGLVKPNSQMGCYAMRYAAKYYNIWIIKFLIKKGFTCNDLIDYTEYGNSESLMNIASRSSQSTNESKCQKKMIEFLKLNGIY